MAKSGAVEFVAPTVRVPIVFRLVSVQDAKTVFGELVVYPARPAHWDKNTQLVTVGTPDWFDTWSEAVGLPVRSSRSWRRSMRAIGGCRRNPGC